MNSTNALYKKCSLRYKVSKWTTADLLDELIFRHNKIMAYKIKPLGIDPFDQDMFEACYAEVLHRMGKSKKKIRKAIQKYPLLFYR